MRTKDIALIALFAAIMVVLGFFPLIELPLVTALLCNAVGGAVAVRRAYPLIEPRSEVAR